jgi:hypothetical protein
LSAVGFKVSIKNTFLRVPYSTFFCHWITLMNFIYVLSHHLFHSFFLVRWHCFIPALRTPFFQFVWIKINSDLAPPRRSETENLTSIVWLENFIHI